MSPESFARGWDAARDWSAWLETVEDKRDIWESNLRRAAVGEAEARRLDDLPGPRRVLVLVEDWCGDAARSVPVIIAALKDRPDVELRLLDTDDHPELLDEHLTHGGRAIPLALVADGEGRPLGLWGPRPAPLQALLRQQKAEQGPPTAETKGSWYAPIMAWYAQDKGVTTLQELLMVLERGGEPR